MDFKVTIKMYFDECYYHDYKQNDILHFIVNVLFFFRV